MSALTKLAPSGDSRNLPIWAQDGVKNGGKQESCDLSHLSQDTLWSLGTHFLRYSAPSRKGSLTQDPGGARHSLSNPHLWKVWSWANYSSTPVNPGELPDQKLVGWSFSWAFFCIPGRMSLGFPLASIPQMWSEIFHKTTFSLLCTQGSLVYCELVLT